jgi:hypothetical protein
MTRPLRQVEEVLRLREAGLGARRIFRATGIPTKTVQGWLSNPALALARPRVSGQECRGSCIPGMKIEPLVYSYALGTYLGDGHIVASGRVFRLTIACDPKYEGILEQVRDTLGALLPVKVSLRPLTGCLGVNAYSCHWPCLFPQHGPGKKHNRPIQLQPWQQEIVEGDPKPFVRGLIHSDGWRGYNVAIRHTVDRVERRRYTRYQFSNRSLDIQELFCWALDLLGVHWTQSNQWTISIARRKDVAYLDTFVGPKR